VDSCIEFAEAINSSPEADVDDMSLVADKCKPNSEDEENDCAVSSQVDPYTSSHILPPTQIKTDARHLQVLTQPRDSAPLDDDIFTHEEPPTIDYPSSPSSTAIQQHLPVETMQPFKLPVEAVQPYTSPEKLVEGRSVASKQQQKLPHAARRKKGAAAAAQKNDLRKYYPVVKGDAAHSMQVLSAKSNAREPGQPLLQQFCGIKPAAAALPSHMPPASSPPPPTSFAPTCKVFSGFRECGAAPIESFNGRTASRRAAAAHHSRQGCTLLAHRTPQPS
jgi:hypothetical protein